MGCGDVGSCDWGLQQANPLCNGKRLQWCSWGPCGRHHASDLTMEPLPGPCKFKRPSPSIPLSPSVAKYAPPPAFGHKKGMMGHTKRFELNGSVEKEKKKTSWMRLGGKWKRESIGV
jgi:hypothetical protein